MRKTTEQLEILNTKNLLAYYRAERKRYNSQKSEYTFGVDKVDYLWDWYDDEKYQVAKKKFDEWEQYLSAIKQILNTREHIYGRNN